MEAGPSQDDVLGFDDCKTCENAAESECSDRLSELPDSLILQILSLLPMRDVVRTTFLSKRWKDLWTTIPCLSFKHGRKSVTEYDSLGVFVNFVNQALLLWKGSKIIKFSISFCWDYSIKQDYVRGCLDKWLNVALENEVEELYVNLGDERYACSSSYFPPQGLYSCSSIRKLSLLDCNLENSGNVQWDKLKSLSIGRLELKEHAMTQVLSGSPQLEVLNLRLWESINHLNIHSSSLKKLKIEKIFDCETTAARSSELTIWAPNIEILEMSGAMYSKYIFMNVSSLTNVTLTFSLDNWQCTCYPENDYDYYDNPEAVEEEMYKSRTEELMRIFQMSRRVENFTLSDWCIQALVKMKDNPHSLPSDAKFLKLYVLDVIEHRLLDVLKMFPKLTVLVLEDTDLSDYEVNFLRFNPEEKCIKHPIILTFDEENLMRSKRRLGKCHLPHLRTVEINWVAETGEINWFVHVSPVNYLVEFLQKYAWNIETILIRPTVLKRPTPRRWVFGGARSYRA